MAEKRDGVVFFNIDTPTVDDIRHLKRYHDALYYLFSEIMVLELSPEIKRILQAHNVKLLPPRGVNIDYAEGEKQNIP